MPELGRGRPMSRGPANGGYGSRSPPLAGFCPPTARSRLFARVCEPGSHRLSHQCKHRPLHWCVRERRALMAILTDQSRSSVARRASRISAALLFVLAAYVVVNAAYGLWRHEGQEFSTPGLILAVVTIPVMWWLARAKMRVADQIGSRALRADAVESITCGYLSGVVVLGLIAQLFMPGWWWVDSAASLAIVILLIKEACEAWEGEESEVKE